MNNISSCLLVCILFILCGAPYQQVDAQLSNDFQKGYSYANDIYCPQVKYDQQGSDYSLGNLTKTGANWVSIIVVWFVKDINSTTILPGKNTATDAQLVHAIMEAHNKKLSVMLKAHVDPVNTEGGVWRGDIGQYFNDTDLTLFFESYKIFIGHYATIAQQYGVEQFAVGTELESLDPHDPYWRDVVKHVQGIYDGKLTYAANWEGPDSYSPFSITWWDVVDFIGVDAYYPIAPDNDDPSLQDLIDGWSDLVSTLEDLSNTYNRPLIFTEIGYPSQDGANVHPYEYVADAALNYQLQSDLYQAVFEAVAIPNRSWFKGIFWWAWLTDPKAGTWEVKNSYTPQNKPVIAILTKYYKNN
jgi:hypothetical protein